MKKTTRRALRVLLVEDNPGDVELVREAADQETPPLEFRVCETLAAAFDAVEQSSFHIILLDLGLPDSTGGETVERMKSAAPNTPIIVLTGHDDREVASQCIALGAHDYLIKGQAQKVLAGAVRNTMARARAQEALTEAQQRLQAVFESTADYLMLLDREHRVQMVNRLEPGLQESDVVGTPLYELVAHPEDGQRIRRLLDLVLRDGVIQKYDTTHVRPDGCTITFHSVAAPVAVGGQVVGTVVSSRDVTESIHSAERLRALSEIVEQTPDGIVCTDLDFKITYLNKAAEDMFGWTLDEVRGRTPDLFNVDPRPDHRQEEIVHRITSETVFEGEALNQRKDGSTFVCQFKIAPLVDDSGEPVGYMGAQRDITERTELESDRERALRESAALLRGTGAVLQKPDFASAAREVFEVCAEHVGATGGYVALLSEDGTDNEVVFLEAGDLPCSVDPALPMPIRGLRETAYRKGSAVFENAFRSSAHWELMPRGHADLENVLFAPLVLDGEPVGLLGLANKPGGFDERDARMATAFGEIMALALREHRTRKDLRAEKEKWQSLVTNAPDVVFTLNRDGVIEFINRVVPGFDLDEVIGSSFLSCLPEQSHAVAMEAFTKVIETGEPSTYEAVGYGPDGGTVWYSTRLGAIMQDGQVTGVTVIATDVTESRKLQSHLAQSDRLASMGMLAAGVAHEINNPLTYVLYNLQSLAEDLPQLIRAASKLRQALGEVKATELLKEAAKVVDAGSLDDVLQRTEDAVEGACRVRDIVKELKTFTRVDEDRATPVSLNDTIETAINMAFNEIKYRASLVKEYGELPTLMANDGKLAQVFLNLIVNAAQSIEEGNTDHNAIRVRTWVDGDHVVAEVADTGAGIAQQDIYHLFDPFFTTKQVGVGSGLGLSICHTIVSELGGVIDVESELGTGSRFTVRLPIETQREAKPSAREPAVPAGARGRFLIVDDERHIGKAMQRMLSDEHDTVSVTSGSRAMEVLEADQAFDGIICDLMMPEVTGMDLHHWLIHKNPKLAEKMIFITGGVFTPRAKEFLNEVGNPRLEKPFDPKSLKAWLRKGLAAS